MSRLTGFSRSSPFPSLLSSLSNPQHILPTTPSPSHTPRLSPHFPPPHHPRRRLRHDAHRRHGHRRSLRQSLDHFRQHPRSLPLVSRSRAIGEVPSRRRPRHPSRSQKRIGPVIAGLPFLVSPKAP